MSGHLTDADREALRDASPGDETTSGWEWHVLYRAVEAIVARHVAAAVQDATDRVLAVHPNEDGYCGSCIDAYESPHEWPCPTVAALAHPTDPTPGTRTSGEACGNCGADTFECSACGAGRGA